MAKKSLQYLSFALVLALFLAPLFQRLARAPEDKRLKWPRAVHTTPFAQRELVVDGLRLRYLDEGKGPPILLIHGHTGRIEEHDEIVKQLRRRFRVLAFDFPGSGYSDKPEREYTLRFYEDTALAFLDQLGIKQCYLAGGSLGGNLTLRLAARAPERFTRLVAWSPGSAWEAKPTQAGIIRFFTGYGNYPFFRAMVRVQSTYWHRPTWPGREAALQDAFATYDEVVSPGFVMMYWGIAADQWGSSLFDVAPKVKQPLLLIWGEEDSTPGMGPGIKRVCQLAAHCEFLSFPGAGHSVAMEYPEKFNQAALEFLTRPEGQLP